jgi:hypothetical protein
VVTGAGGSKKLLLITVTIMLDSRHFKNAINKVALVRNKTCLGMVAIF